MILRSVSQGRFCLNMDDSEVVSMKCEVCGFRGAVVEDFFLRGHEPTSVGNRASTFGGNVLLSQTKKKSYIGTHM